MLVLKWSLHDLPHYGFEINQSRGARRSYILLYRVWDWLFEPSHMKLQTLDQSQSVCLCVCPFIMHNISNTTNQIFINGRKRVSLLHFGIFKLRGWRGGCIKMFIWLVTDWLKWGLHHSMGTACVRVVLLRLPAIQLAIRHSSRPGTGAEGLNAKF